MNKTEKIDYWQVFQLFVNKHESRDNYRRYTQKPFKRGGMYYATDALSMIFIPVDKADLHVEEKYQLDPKAVISEEKNCSDKIDVAELEKKLVPEMVEEENVEIIERECTCHDRANCTVCDGYGSIIRERRMKTGKMIHNQLKVYKMYEAKFTYKQLIRLVVACKMMRIETITRVYGSERFGNLFQCGDASILVMPMYGDDNEAITVIYK